MTGEAVQAKTEFDIVVWLLVRSISDVFKRRP